MKNSLTNPVKYNKVIIAEAILLTVALHALFFAIFTVPSVKNERTEHENISVTLLRYPEQNSKDNAIFAQLNNYSPRHFSDPHSKIGFNGFRSDTGRKFIPPPKINLSSENIISHKYRIADTVLPSLPPAKNTLQNFQRDTKYTTAPKTEYPFAAASSGILIPLTFSTDELQMMREFPLSNSIYKLFYDKNNSMMPRLILIKSCGRRVLDKLSIRILYQELKKLTQCADGEIFTVYYGSDNAAGDEL